ncbi:hypothetical protein [Algoriphagus aquimarinus]|uniref:Uncharacterized protein n=1 Tax=Algoriphagus aquimarinus TaxID=237018 RepID=A0A5C7AX56_9BACT|nr:hypothetical protein [Algoriphagus aquimarinus]TXE10292.1 hypothetical protein ESV85_13230 [Algoriphagus aquimarinus]
MENLISIVIPEADIIKVRGDIQDIQTTMDPYFTSLTKGRAKRLTKMADGTLPFVEKATEFAISNPQFNPPFLEVEEMKKDLDAYKQLKPFMVALEQLLESFKYTISLTGSEAYDQARIYYNSIKYAAKMGVPGAQAIYDELRKRFEHQGPKEMAGSAE